MSGWSIRARILVTLVALLLFTALGAWVLTSGVVLRPLLAAVVHERVEVAGFIAREVYLAEDREGRAAELAEALGVEIVVQDEPPNPTAMWTRQVGYGRHKAWVEQAPGSPIHVPLGRRGDPETSYLTVRFVDDLRRPGRVVALGLLMLVFVSAGAALLMSRWASRPLELAGEAMTRIAGGELEHRLPVGRGEAGQMARAFNHMAAEVEARVEHERRLTEAQRRMMAAVSHELRTPLARMRLQTELLADAGADPQRIASLERQVAEVDALVGELLESARLDQGVLALELEEVGLQGLFEEVLATVDLGERPVALELEPGLSVRGDRRRLLRALGNLLSNVARYTPPECPVTLSARASGASVELVVADRGPGVDPEDLPHLFEPFFRAEASRSKVLGGLGLGLMLVRQIALAHGGSVAAHLREGGGLEVVLRLPLGDQARAA